MGVVLMNRRLRRALQSKLGEDFPLDKLLSLYAYYSSLQLSLEDFILKMLRDAVDSDFENKKEIIERMKTDEEIL